MKRKCACCGKQFRLETTPRSDLLPSVLTQPASKNASCDGSATSCAPTPATLRTSAMRKRNGWPAAAKLVVAMRAPFDIEQRPTIHITVSIGVAFYWCA